MLHHARHRYAPTASQRRLGFVRRAARLLGLVMTMCVITPAIVQAADRAEWRTLRHDTRNSRASTGTGKLAVPVPRWRVRIGGQAEQVIGADVTLDGQDNVLAVVSGAVVARHWNGAVLWKTPAFGALSIAGVSDVTGDGVDEVVVRTERGVRILSSLKGTVVWASPVGSFDRLKLVVVRDFDGDGFADVALANDGGYSAAITGDVSMYGYVGGAKKRFSTDKSGPYGKPIQSAQFSIQDIDGDGLPDFVLFTTGSEGSGWLAAYSGKTGKLVAKSKQLSAFTCQRRSKLSSNGLVCMVEAASKIRPAGLRAFKREGDQLVEDWAWLHPDKSKGYVSWIGHFDFDGNGHREIQLFARGLGLVAIDTATGSVVGKPYWSPKLGDLTASVVAQVWTTGAPSIFLRGFTVDPSAPAPTHVLTWSVVGGFQYVSALGTGLLSTLRLQPPQGMAPPAPAALGGGGNSVWRLDTDGDGLVDSVEVRHIAVTPGATPNVAGKLASKLIGKLPYDALGAGMLWLQNKGGGAIAVRDAEDAVWIFSPDGALLNDTNGDKRPDLTLGGSPNVQVRVGWLGAKDSAPHVLLGMKGRVLALNPAGADATKPPKLQELLRAGTGLITALPLDGDGDGDREVLAMYRPVGQGVRVQSFSPDGSGATSTWTSNWTWQAADMDLRFSFRRGPQFQIVAGAKAGSEQLLMGMRRATLYSKGGLRLLDAATGKLAWKPTADAITSDNFSHPTVILNTKDGPAALLSLYTTRVRYLLTDGTTQALHTGKEPRYGIPKLVDTDGDGTNEVLIASAGAGIGLEQSADHAAIWLQKGSAWQNGESALVTVNGAPHLAALLRGTARIELRDTKTGSLVWSFAYSAGKALKDGDGTSTLSGFVAVPDLTGDGVPALLFTAATGRLYAVNAVTGAVIWSRTYGGTVSMPIVADIDGDGLVEILVATPDGFLEALDTNTLGIIDWVRDNAGQGPAMTDADDIDAQPATDVLHANWAKLPGASGYSVRVVTKAGAVITPWKDVGETTQTTITGLNLQLATIYQTQVRGYGGTAGDKVFSATTSSDGVQVVDAAAPTITRIAVNPPILVADNSGATIELEAIDDTRLAVATCTIVVDAGLPAPGPVVAVMTRKLTVTKTKLELPWNGLYDISKKIAEPGPYRVICKVTDVGQNTTSAEAPLLICQPGEIVKAGACQTPSVNGGDAGSDGDTGNQLNGERVESCGCAVRGGKGMLPTGGSGLVLLLCIMVMGRRRRAR